MSEVEGLEAPSSTDIAKDKWIEGFLGRDIPPRGRGMAIGSDREKPNPDKLLFEQTAAQNLEGLRALQNYESTDLAVKAAQQKVAKSLDDMDKSTDGKDWTTPLGHLNAAIEARKEFDGAVQKVDQARAAFLQRYNPIVGRRQKALDLIPDTVRLADAKAAVVQADGVLQPLIDRDEYGATAGPLTTLIGALDEFDRKVAEAGNETAKSITDTKAGLKKLVEQAKKAIGKVSRGQEKKALSERLAELSEKVKALDKMTDQTDLLFQFSRLEPVGSTLLSDALKASNASAKDKQAAYKEVLSARFDIEIKIPKGMTNSHLDRAFDMFMQVPRDHVGHDKLKILKYDDTAGQSGSYNKTENRMTMGRFAEDSTDTYTIGGIEVKPNRFDVTTLHEIGHAVDAKFKVMENHMSAADHGGWSVLRIGQVAQAFADDFKANNRLNNVKDEDLLGQVLDALNTGATGRLRSAFPDDDDWAKIRPLLQKCAGIRDKSPWKRIVTAGIKAYHKAYDDGRWVCYDPAAKTSTFVHTYQWRAPGEWFAEIYAITWLRKEKPPSGVGAAAAGYMWGGASIGNR